MSERFENVVFEINVTEMLELIQITIISKKSLAIFFIVELGTAEGFE